MIRRILIIILNPINYTLADDYISKDPNGFGDHLEKRMENRFY